MTAAAEGLGRLGGRKECIHAMGERRAIEGEVGL